MGATVPDGRGSLKWEQTPGMTLRDHFAGLAMQGWMSLEGSVDHRFMAETCYRIADAMLEARK